MCMAIDTTIRYASTREVAFVWQLYARCMVFFIRQLMLTLSVAGAMRVDISGHQTKPFNKRMILFARQFQFTEIGTGTMDLFTQAPTKN